jgi:lysozyme family protein
LKAAERLLADEGGYVNDPSDAGGETRYGLSKREYPSLDIKNLSRDEALAIYYRDWWQRFRYAELPGPIGAKVFDLAVNMGPGAATRCLQRALRACGKAVAEDGALGKATVAAVRVVSQLALAAALRSEAAGYYRVIATARRGSRESEEFIRGWLNRAYE